MYIHNGHYKYDVKNTQPIIIFTQEDTPITFSIEPEADYDEVSYYYNSIMIYIGGKDQSCVIPYENGKPFTITTKMGGIKKIYKLTIVRTTETNTQ